MTTIEETQLLTRVGPVPRWGVCSVSTGYQPCRAEQLPERECPPVRVRLLGEDLVAFRSVKWHARACLGEHCPHRGASLALARNEDCSLRCLYHGWKTDSEGHVLETPNEPEQSSLRNRVTHTAYPGTRGGRDHLDLHEWIPTASIPALRLVPGDAPEPVAGARAATVQLATGHGRGAGHPPHSNQLHSDVISADASASTVGGVSRRTDDKFNRPSTDGRPQLRVLDTPYGFRYAGIRKTINDPDKFKYVRTTVFVAPFFTFLASSDGIGDVQAYVPIDAD